MVVEGTYVGGMNRWFAYFGSLTPPALRRLIEAMPVETLDARTDPERFTPREVVAHLADFEPIFLSWLHVALDSPGNSIQNWDEDELCSLNDYSSADIQEALARFETARQESLAFVRPLTPEQLGLVSVCEHRGPMSVGDHCGFWLGHDIYHLEQLTEYAAAVH